jgi:hypothetical protein
VFGHGGGLEAETMTSEMSDYVEAVRREAPFAWTFHPLVRELTDYERFMRECYGRHFFRGACLASLLSMPKHVVEGDGRTSFGTAWEGRPTVGRRVAARD